MVAYSPVDYYNLGHVYPRDGLRVPFNRRRQRVQFYPIVLPIGPGKVYQLNSIPSGQMDGVVLPTGLQAGEGILLLPVAALTSGVMNGIGLKEEIQDGVTYLQE